MFETRPLCFLMEFLEDDLWSVSQCCWFYHSPDTYLPWETFLSLPIRNCEDFWRDKEEWNISALSLSLSLLAVSRRQSNNFFETHGTFFGCPKQNVLASLT